MTDSMFVVTNTPHGRFGLGRGGLSHAVRAIADVALAKIPADRYPGAATARAMHDAAARCA